nr:amino acid permease [Rhodococcus opacus]
MRHAVMIGHRGVASSQTVRPRGDGKRKLSVATGLAGLSLDAMASVSYGPEAIVLVLAVAGGAGLGFTLPVTLAIAALLAVLVASYRQLIAAFPGGGGAYAVARKRLGRRSSLTAAASLIIDYVLNVAVSIAAGVAALTSAFPPLLPYTVWIALTILAGITALNLRASRIRRGRSWFRRSCSSRASSPSSSPAFCARNRRAPSGAVSSPARPR